MSDTEAFPGQPFSEGVNNMLNYPDDPGRTEYAGERLAHRSTSGVMTPSQTIGTSEPPVPTPPGLVSADTKLGQISQSTIVPGGETGIQPAPLDSGDIVLSDVPPEMLIVAQDDPSAQATPPSRNEPISRATPRAERKPVPPVQTKTRASAVTVFLASYKSQKDATSGWSKIQKKFATPTAGLNPVVLEVDLGAEKGGIYYRLFAQPFDDRESARQLCRALEAGKQFCRTANSGGRIEW